MTLDQPHLDATRAPEDRANALLGLMTLREKCYQLASVPAWWLIRADLGPSRQQADTLEKAPGHISNFSVDSAQNMAAIVGELQRASVNGTRLGIPLLLHAEALNGFVSGGHMVYPTAVGLGATWSPDLVEKMADLTRTQMIRLGVRQALSPNMDIALDPRWGRFHETYGEDPYLVAAMSVAFTRGLQTKDLRNGVIATAKHWVGYSAPEGGINLSAYEGGSRRTRDLFAFPFEAAIQEAQLGSVMNSYADVDGVPAAVNREILTDLLRDTLGFDGFVSSDYTTLDHLVDRQKVAATPGEAARLAIAAGLDTEFPIPYGYGDALAEQVKLGTARIEDVDTSVLRILTAKFRLGLFENPYPAEQIRLDEVAVEGSELSRELAERSVVLLKNDGILPLDGAGQSVAVVGPHADAITLQFPTYTYPALRQMVARMSSGEMSNMVGVDPAIAEWTRSLTPPMPIEEFLRQGYEVASLAEAVASHAASVVAEPGSTLTQDLGQDATDRAVAAAAESDLVILALGGASLWFNGERTEGEASDSADIALPAAQVRLAEAVHATGTPTIVVLFQGRPYSLPQVVLDASAIVVAPYGGPYGPAAVADVLYGEVNPSGRLPYSIPRHTGQIPVYYHQRQGTGYRNSLPPANDELYLDMPATPLHTFGEGLSYTSFELSDLAAGTSVATSGIWQVSAEVRNTGTRSGATVVQLYVHVNASGVTRPAVQLIGFARVELEPGASSRVHFSVAASQLGFTGLDHCFGVEPGRVDYFVGFHADDAALTGSFDVTGERVLLGAYERTFFADSWIG